MLCYLSVQPLYFMLCFFSERFFSFYNDDPTVHKLMLTLLLPYIFLCSFDSMQFTGCQMYKALEMGDDVCRIQFNGYYIGALGCLTVLNFSLTSKLVCPWWSFAFGLAVVDAQFIRKYMKLELR